MSLFDYPKKSYLGRILPKTKIYEHTGANTKLKELFVRQVDQIVWKNKLAPETINVPATEYVPEIQIFAVSLKMGQLHQDVLRSIDKAIPFPILYEVTYEGKIKVTACYKRPNESDAEKWVVGNYFTTEWLKEAETRHTLPVRLDLGGLYEELLGSLIPYLPRKGETLQQRVERADAIASKEKELAKIEAILEREKQFNRKVEINAKIRIINQQIETLKGLSGK